MFRAGFEERYLKSSHREDVKRKEEGRGESTLEGDLARRRVKRRHVCERSGMRGEK